MARPKGSKNKPKNQNLIQSKEVNKAKKPTTSKSYTDIKRENANRANFKKKFQRKWDACKTSAERAQVKKEFYSYKGKYTETFLDNAWTQITAKFRREILPELQDFLELLTKC